MNQPQENAILDFPFQEKDWDDLEGKELVVHVRYYATRLLNQLAIGEREELSEHLKKRLRGVNMLCRKVGLEPLELPF